MTNTTPVHTATDQYFYDETTIYWFEMDGEQYGIAESGGTRDVLDTDGLPMPEGDEKNEVGAACVVTNEIRDNVY